MKLLSKPLFWTNLAALAFAGWLVASLAFGWTNPNLEPPGGTGSLSAVGNNIGIGTTTPRAALGVSGAGLFEGSLQADYIWATSTSAINYFAGNVLIGMQTSWSPAESQGALRIVSGVGGRIDLRDIDSSGALKNAWEINALNTTGSGGGSLTIADEINNLTRLTIDNTGKVKIGTSLRVGPGTVTLGVGSASIGELVTEDSGWWTGIGTVGSPDLFVDPTGHVGIGFTDADGSYDGRLSVITTASLPLEIRGDGSALDAAVGLFTVKGGASNSTGDALCTAASSNALCLGTWRQDGSPLTCSTTGSLTSNYYLRVLCAKFND